MPRKTSAKKVCVQMVGNSSHDRSPFLSTSTPAMQEHHANGSFLFSGMIIPVYFSLRPFDHELLFLNILLHLIQGYWFQQSSGNFLTSGNDGIHY
mmetsp:Transcript_11313/g.14964  ORF Transcript_11313/g.14964 Transcript_11313/m.14964 type:complete len:95 (-) Transcript_11313:329-613(-)